MKDRIALNMITRAEQAGRISPGTTTLVRGGPAHHRPVAFIAANTDRADAMLYSSMAIACCKRLQGRHEEGAKHGQQQLGALSEK